MLYADFLLISYIWEKLDSRDWGKMLLAYQIERFLNQLYLLKNDENAWVFAYWYKFIEIKGWFKNIEVGMVKMALATMVTGL